MCKTMGPVEAKLKRPFEAREHEPHTQARNRDKTKGMVGWSVDPRLMQDRLDDVVGVGNWQSEARQGGVTEKGVTILVGVGIAAVALDGPATDGWVWRWSAATDADAAVAETYAFKRACLQFGIGRYLRKLPGQWVALKNEGKAFVSEPPFPKGATPEAFDRAVKIIGQSELLPEPTGPAEPETCDGCGEAAPAAAMRVDDASGQLLCEGCRAGQADPPSDESQERICATEGCGAVLESAEERDAGVCDACQGTGGSANGDEHICTSCKTAIDNRVAAYSTLHFKRKLCRACQKQAKARKGGAA